MAAAGTAVVKVGTSSITAEGGELDYDALARLASQVGAAVEAGWRTVLVSSGAIGAGLPVLGFSQRPEAIDDLQALAAVGQGLLVQQYTRLFSAKNIKVGQVLLTAYDFAERTQYLNARRALMRLLDLGVVPLVNENDTVAVDEIRFGDNDRLAGLVAHLVGADALVMLTDSGGLYSEDPRMSESASLIEEVVEVDRLLEDMADREGSALGSGGVASKLAAARMAAWSGARVVIAAAAEDSVVLRALSGEPVGTTVPPHDQRLPSRKLWIAFGTPPKGVIDVDEGAQAALVDGKGSLLPIGVARVSGPFASGDAVEVRGPDGRVFAKGLVGIDSNRLASLAGMRTGDLPVDVRHEVIHRDDLVVLPGA